MRHRARVLLGCDCLNSYNAGYRAVVGGGVGLAGKIQGHVVAISESGDAITEIQVDRLRDVPTDERVSISCDGHQTSCLFPADHQQPPMTFLAVLGTDGYLQLRLVGDSASAFLGFRPGSQVTIRWQ